MIPPVPPKTPPRRTNNSRSRLTPTPLFKTPRPPRTTPRKTPYYTPRSKQKHCDNGDRFIPSRRNLNMDLVRVSMEKKRPRYLDETPLQKEFKRRMLSTICNVPLEMLNEEAKPTGILSFSSKAHRKTSIFPPSYTNPFSLDILRSIKVGETDDQIDYSVSSKVVRKVPNTPVRILDAPDMIDDYYLSLISWSKNNILAVALGRSVYLWNAGTGEIHHLVTVAGSDYATSVEWCKEQPKYLAIGTHNNEVHIYDGETLQKVRSLPGATGRIASLSWNGQTLCAGDRDARILHHDTRMDEHIVNIYKGHTQEVCGLKWNEEGKCLASGGNENHLCLWDAAMSGRRQRHGEVNVSAPRLVLKQHKAAVKALDWCPFHRGLLASGGGTADRTIKFWNSQSGNLLNSIDTGSQVCSIVWSRHQRELCSSHGYSQNQLILWRYPSMMKIKELTGHTARVLNMDLSPDGGSIVSAGADETLRFWNIFDTPRRLNGVSLGDLDSLNRHTIR